MQNILKNISNENFNDYLSSVERCLNNLSTISFSLESYKNNIGNNKKKALIICEGQLFGSSKSIELENSYKLYCQLIGVEYFVEGEAIDDIPLFSLIEALSPINVPLYPWQSVEDNNFLLYENSTEESYFNDLVGSKNNLVSEKEVKENSFYFKFDKKFLEIINEMKKYPRSKEVLTLFQTYLLNEELNNSQKNPDLTFDQCEIVNIKKLNITKRTQNDKNRSPESESRELFIKHFMAVKKLIELRGVSKFNKDVDDSKWIELQVKLKSFGENLLNIKNNFSTTLLDIKKSKTDMSNNQLYKEVKDFFQDRDLTCIEKFPTAREISGRKPGGAGILKKITQYGGLSKFEIDYRKYLEKIEAAPKAIVPKPIELKTNGSYTPPNELLLLNSKIELKPNDSLPLPDIQDLLNSKIELKPNDSLPLPDIQDLLNSKTD